MYWILPWRSMIFVTRGKAFAPFLLAETITDVRKSVKSVPRKRRDSIKKLYVDTKCGNYDHKIRIDVTEMVARRPKRWRHYRTTFQFPGDDGRQVQRATDDLEREIKRLGCGLTV
jgi:hypothetical protein